MRLLGTLIINELRSIYRDLLLVVSMLAPIILTIVFKWGLPMVEDWLWVQFEYDITSFRVYILSIGVLFTPFMIGAIGGLLLLDDRDNGILRYYAVTPLKKSGYLVFRLASPMILCILFSYVLIYGSDLIELNFLLLFPIVLVLSLNAPIVALFMAGLAKNKVEGLAYFKVSSLSIAAPVISFFIAKPWSYAFGIIPPYWISTAFLAVYIHDSRMYWISIGVGLGIHCAWFYLLLKRFLSKLD